eukprot:1160420-Pelagomonas_calceolata.AAC.8
MARIRPVPKDARTCMEPLFVGTSRHQHVGCRGPASHIALLDIKVHKKTGAPGSSSIKVCCFLSVTLKMCFHEG